MYYLLSQWQCSVWHCFVFQRKGKRTFSNQFCSIHFSELVSGYNKINWYRCYVNKTKCKRSKVWRRGLEFNGGYQGGVKFKSSQVFFVFLHFLGFLKENTIYDHIRFKITVVLWFILLKMGFNKKKRLRKFRLKLFSSYLIINLQRTISGIVKYVPPFLTNF